MSITASEQRIIESNVILRGARRIGEVVGLDEKAAQHLLNRGALRSARKVRGRWFAPQRELLREFGVE
jgi:hypothetical protein